MTPAPMRLLYYLMLTDSSKPIKDREAARETFIVALNIDGVLGGSNMRKTLIECLKLANDEDTSIDSVDVLSISKD